MNTFAARLRALSKDASPGPWFGGHLSETDAACDCTYVLNGHMMGDVATFAVRKDGDPHGSEYPTKSECIANMALTTTLRNHADRLADLVERAGDVLVAYDALVTGKPMPAHGSIDRLRAALAALDGGGA